MKKEDAMYGVYQGRVERVRYKRGAVFVQAKLYGLSTSDKDTGEHPWFTPLALVTMNGTGSVGDSVYGEWHNPKVGDNALIVFEQGNPGLPYCIGFLPHFNDMPTEFDNDDYLNKEREAEDRREPTNEDIPKSINNARMVKTILQYLLLHDKTNHLVLDAKNADDMPAAKLELGEAAEFAIALGDRLVENFLKHKHKGAGKITNLDSDEAEYYLSTLSFTRKDPREDGADSGENAQTEKAGSEIGDMAASFIDTIKDFAEGFCKFATTADDFVNDPVGTVVDGIADAAEEYAGTLVPEIDVETAKDEAVAWIGDLGNQVGKATTDALTDWTGDGALGALLSTEDGQALSDTISVAASSATDSGAAIASGFVNDAFDTLTEWADGAGIADAIDDLASDVLGGAIDAGIEVVKGAADEVIGSAVSDVVDSVPGVKSALDIAAGICNSDPSTVIKGVFGFLVDAANVVTAGLLTPYVAKIKTVGAGLIDGAFSNEADAGEEQVANGRE